MFNKEKTKKQKKKEINMVKGYSMKLDKVNVKQ
jgi:hypothetical protein